MPLPVPLSVVAAAAFAPVVVVVVVVVVVAVVVVTGGANHLKRDLSGQAILCTEPDPHRVACAVVEA